MFFIQINTNECDTGRKNSFLDLPGWGTLILTLKSVNSCQGFRIQAGDSALHLAVRANNLLVAEALLHCGADPNIRNQVYYILCIYGLISDVCVRSRGCVRMACVSCKWGKNEKKNL